MTWNNRPEHHFKRAGDMNAWNARFANTTTGTESRGYLRVNISGERVLSHRLAWLYVYGVWPLEIDHINGVKDDNRISNLRSVNRQTNLRNTKIRLLNTSGHVGVSMCSRSKKWFAYITNNGKKSHLGQFLKIQDAVNARKSAEERLGFHPNHGRK